MKVYKHLGLFIALVTSCSSFNEPASNIKLPAMFSNNMVLQKGIDIPFWGTAGPGGRVTIIIDDKKAGAKADKNGHWRTEFPAFEEYGGPFTVNICGTDTIKYDNVLIGEVWVCSGQSNMEMPLAGWGRINNYQQEITNASHSNIRLFTVPRTISAVPLYDTESMGWVQCSPQNIPEFSATGYFFGRKLNRELDVPVGLIHTSWGGTPAEAWTSLPSLSTLKDYKYLASDVDKAPTAEKLLNRYKQRMLHFTSQIDSNVNSLPDFDLSWKSPGLDASSWQSMILPTTWEKAGVPNFDGIIWFVKEINLSKAEADQDAQLALGPIDDTDFTYVNGEMVGMTASYNVNRVYDVPAAILKPGINRIAVQVYDFTSYGGIWGDPNDMKFTTGDGNELRLDGVWKYRVGPALQYLPTQPAPPNTSNSPGYLYNGMIHPLIPFAIRGAIWYQGEANTMRAHQYQELFKTMITDWRQAWGQGDFPFILTQLANYMGYKPEPTEDDWAELREAQTMALKLPNTAMAVTIDIGNAEDIHPKNKQEVGRRLALNALNMVYGKTDVVPCGPLYKSSEVQDGKIVISFDHVDGGLVAKNGDLEGFAIAGADKKWVWANAKIEGETVEVWSEFVPKPAAVRYAWQSNPRCNLFNAAGLPTSPFRTDDWPGITL